MRPHTLALTRGSFLLTGLLLLTGTPVFAGEPQAAPMKQVAEGAPAKASRFMDAAHSERAAAVIAKAEAYLRSRQDQATGGWSVPKPVVPEKAGGLPATPPQAQPHLPAVSALVLRGLMMNPKADPVGDAALAKAAAYILRFRQPDGGIYDRILPSYNTSLALSALARVKTPEAQAAMRPAQEFLKSLQWGSTAPAKDNADAPTPVGPEHIYYGGVGYGKHGRPDNSNLNMFMQAMEDSGVSPEDEAVKRALEFLRRTQMDERVNDMPYAKGSRQGGLVYATAENAQSVDGRPGQSQAGTMEETLSDGTRASRLRAYGSMTYAGFKSYLYAELPKDDPRVAAAFGWIRRNYSVDENPGIGSSGQYYYYLVFARALAALGTPTLDLLDEHDNATGQTRRWAEDLADKFAALQQADGSFKSLDKRWMEDNPELITAYALVALRFAAE